MKPPSQRLRICVSLNTAYEHQRGLFFGIQRYARSQRDWELLLISHEAKVAGEIERVENVAGVIGFFSGDGTGDPHLRAAKAVAGERVVGVSGKDAASAVPRVVPDDRAVGRMAADYLMSLHFRHFAFLRQDIPGVHASMVLREEGFIERLAQRGHACGILRKADVYGPEFKPRPQSAVFAFNIHLARELIEILAKRRIAVPEEVAVMGVDRDPFIQKLSPVEISTVALNTEAMGWAAAALLHRLLRGEQVAPGHLERIPPLQVDAGTSTEVLPYDDPVIRKALGLLRRNLVEVADVATLASLVGASRSTLERRFRETLGTTVRSAIEAARVDKAQTLLSEGELRMADIAAATGFGDARMFSVVFRRVVGETPSQFRKRQQG